MTSTCGRPRAQRRWDRLPSGKRPRWGTLGVGLGVGCTPDALNLIAHWLGQERSPASDFSVVDAELLTEQRILVWEKRSLPFF